MTRSSNLYLSLFAAGALFTCVGCDSLSETFGDGDVDVLSAEEAEAAAEEEISEANAEAELEKLLGEIEADAAQD